jgi:hypothetical protein
VTIVLILAAPVLLYLAYAMYEARLLQKFLSDRERENADDHRPK